MRDSIFRRFTLLSVVIAFAALIPLAAFGLYAIEVISDHLVRETVEKLQGSVLDDADKIKRVFDMAQGDLPILSQLPEMRELVRAKAGTNLREIELARTVVGQVFLTFSSNRKVYNQLRYLDENGREVVRVDYDGTHPPRLIPWERLQEQRQRDYFSETMTLEPGQVYTSPLGLNQERGQIEVPYHPVIRYATPLFDDAGHRRGIVIINLMVGPFLDELYHETKAARKVVYAVDQEGFYLLHPDPVKQWGGPRDLNTGERLQRDFPTLASQILSQQAVATVMGKQVITSQSGPGRGQGTVAGSVVGEQVITSQSLALSASRSGPSLVIIELMPTLIVLAPVADLR
ncbi:cache domain-containing protein, partial [Candidatus Methylomirabilis sp.]|uniref:cache domain-containing protein n=1 Tax=Candidatus Methylomirabilis sp. TaxID=2032687 RepID=UPI003C77D2B9